MLSNKKHHERPRRNRTTDVILLLDMSGSMQVRRDATIREVNRYLDSLKSDGYRYWVTVKTFNEYVDTLISHKKIQDVGTLEHEEYHPNGWTRLLDAVGSTLTNLYYPYRDYDYNRTLFVVVTDGQENDSREYGLAQVRGLIDQKRRDGIQFVFLGDGPGAWQVGSRLGFNYSVSVDWAQNRSSEDIYKSLYTASASMSAGQPIAAQMFNTNSTSATTTAPIVPEQKKSDD